MATTDIDICAGALIRLGEPAISSFEDETDAATICAQVYPDLRDGILSMYPWRITMAKEQLAQLSAAPLNEWNYAYQLPSGMLALRTVMDSVGTTPNDVTEFEIFERQLHTDEAVIAVEYQFQADEADWPPYLVSLMIMAMAAEIAPSVTDQTNKEELWRTKAFGLPGERMQGGFFAVAKRIDSQGSPPAVVDNYDLVFVRNGGVGNGGSAI